MLENSIKGRFLGKAKKTTLTLCLLQQQAHVASHIQKRLPC